MIVCKGDGITEANVAKCIAKALIVVAAQKADM